MNKADLAISLSAEGFIGGTGDQRGQAGDGQEVRSGWISGVCKSPETARNSVRVPEKSDACGQPCASVGGERPWRSSASQSMSVATLPSKKGSESLLESTSLAARGLTCPSLPSFVPTWSHLPAPPAPCAPPSTAGRGVLGKVTAPVTSRFCRRLSKAFPAS